ncbi:methyl-accepting chemotaxis protein [Halomonas cibimaris]|uniref:Methyl-accepting chemotaxis protein n=1 Tax=Halomonas cibimaris TaxID=657012 RepID=A0ABP7LI39_9GAMM
MQTDTTAIVGIVRMSLDGVVLYVNHGFEQLTGESESPVGQHWARLLAPGEEQTPRLATLKRLLGRERVWTGELWLAARAGQPVRCRVTATPLYDDTRLSGAALVCRPLAAGAADTPRRGRWLRRLNPASLTFKTTALGTLAVAMIAGAIGVGSLLSSNAQQAISRTGESISAIANLNAIEGASISGRREINQAMADLDHIEDPQRFKARLEGFEDAMLGHWQTFLDAMNPELGIDTDELDTLLQGHYEDGIYPAMRHLLDDGDQASAREAFGAFLSEDAGVFSRRLSEMSQRYQQEAVEAANQSERFQHQIANGLWLGGLLSLAVFLATCVKLIRDIRRPMRSAQLFAMQIAAGNLKAHPPHQQNTEIGRVLDAVELMTLALEGLIDQVRRGVDTVTPAADGVARSSQTIAAQFEQQASAVQQTAAAMDEISTTVHQNADNAQAAAAVSNDNAQKVQRAEADMHALSTSMGEIHTQTTAMEALVQQIDEVAFQTNILALNASVEAARAGEQGRGFAVVAQEVRNLAQRSAQTASEVKSMIARAQQAVAKGVQDTETTGAVMEDIQTASSKINDLIDEISQAAKEQSDGVSQVSQAIAQIDDAIQSSSGELSGLDSASQALNEEARILTHSAQAFETRRTRFSRAADEAGAPLAEAPARTRAHTQEDWDSF